MAEIFEQKQLSGLEGLLENLLAGVERADQERGGSRANPAREVESLVRRDYGLPVRRSFDRAAIRQFISEGRRRVWPRLNIDPLRLGSPQEFREAWSSLGIEFRTANLSSPRGLALLGFYIEKSPSSKRPLICVNTAHHRAAMSAAFAHEMGHHLTSKMFDCREDEPHMMGYVGYGDHLEDPPELAADVLVSLGIFPQAIARKHFDGSLRGGKRGEAGKGVLGAVAYIANKYGFNADPKLSGGNRLQYLAGVLHYAKLREALLSEFGV